MKTLNKVSFIVFVALGSVATLAALFGATHQFVMAGICFFVAWMHRADNRKYKTKITNN